MSESRRDTLPYLYDRAEVETELQSAMERTRFAPVVVAVVLVAAVFAGVAPVAASAQPSASVGDYTVTRGETVSISVGHSGPANLTITGGGFELLVGFGGSGTSTVELDTYRSDGNASEFVSGGAPDMMGPPLDEALQPGEYVLEVTIDEETEAYGTLTILPNGEMTSQTGALPGDYFEGDGGGNGLGAVQTHAEIGRGNDNVVVGDYAAFVVDENDSGIGAPFDGDASVDDLRGEGFEMRVEELDPEPNTNEETYTAEDVRVAANFGGEDGQFAVLWDTSGIDLGAGSNHTYGFELAVDETKNPLFSENQTLLTERVTLVDPSVSIGVEPGSTLAPWDGNQLRVHGETNLLPGTALNVRALKEPPEPHLWQDDASVTQNGSFTATLEFTDASRPTEFPLWVRNYESQTRHTVRLTAASASLLFPAQTVSNGSVTVERVTLSRGGFLRLTANNSTVGTVGPLPQMTNGSVDVGLNASFDAPTNVTATAIVDADGDGVLDDADPAYENGSSPVAETALVKPAAPATTTAPENNTTTTQTATRTTERTLAVSDEEPLAPVANNGGSSGGFVPLSPATTLVAVAAALLLAARRGPDRL